MQVRISRWIFDNNERGEIPMLDHVEIERLVNLPPLRMEQRVERLLIRFNRRRIAAGVNLLQNSIDDEIIAEIRRSWFVVADFTCGTVPHEGKEVAIPRGGVYYEAGFAQGLNVPLI